jgi:AcrR family transcriptional regulator
MRADARRNRRRLLDAAIQLILEIGGEPSRDAVAQRAGVGIGTLYRHFPDQQALLRAVVLDVLDRTIHLGETALAESTNGREALRRYLHGAIDNGLGVVNVIYPMLEDTNWPERRSAAGEVIELLTEVARRDGAVGKGVTASDIAIASIRFCRPLAIGLDPGDEREFAHRHLDNYLDGLAANAN